MTRAESATPPICGACQSRAVTYVCNLPLYVRGGNVPDTIWRCSTCGTYIRAINYDEVTRHGHFDVASYTNPANEVRLYTERKNFFRYIVRVAGRSLDRPICGMRILDVGCSFGHLMDLFHMAGARVAGVEIVDHLRAHVARKGYEVYRSLPEIAPEKRFDAVTLLDSLYLLEVPGETLRQVRFLLDPKGILILRVTNRTPVLDLLRCFRQPITDALVGDAKHNFSYQGLRRLLIAHNYGIHRVLLNEKGKRIRGARTQLYYRLSLILSVVLRLKLTPGLILIARRAKTST